MEEEGYDPQTKFALFGSTLEKILKLLRSQPVAGTGINVSGDGDSPVWSVNAFRPPCQLEQSSNGGLVVSPFRLVKREGSGSTSDPFVPTIGGVALDAVPAPVLAATSGGGGVWLEYSNTNGEIVAAASFGDLPDSDDERYFRIGSYIVSNGNPLPIWSWDGNVFVQVNALI